MVDDSGTMKSPGLEKLLREAKAFFDHERYKGAGAAIIRKRPRLKPIFTFVSRASQSRFGNLLMLTVIILFYHPFRRPAAEPVFQYGMSANNIRSFRRINACACRTDLDRTINGERLPLTKRFLCLLPLRKLWYTSNILVRERAMSSFTHAQLVIASSACLIYGKEDLSRLDVICVASDHSPITMALLHIARLQRVKTCYLQHAPVANYFPPLNYDLSILFDRQSATIYEEAAANRNVKNRGDIIILPPFDENAKKFTVRETPYRVGVFLSYLFSELELIRLLVALAEHPRVDKIAIRRHPRCKANISEITKISSVYEPEYTSVNEFVAHCDVLLVPNSGVAIESLHLGVPTFYTPNIDYIEDDYYGFVKSGILPIFDLNILENSDKLNGFFDRNWTAKFVAYDETSAIDLADSQNNAGRAFRALLGFADEAEPLEAH